MHTLITKELKKLEEENLKRALTVIEGPQGPRVRINGNPTILLCSNDYLGLANHPRLKEAAIRAIEKWGIGAGASRLVSGTMEPHILLEEKLAAFKKTEAALIFNSGYHANLGVIGALAALTRRTTAIFSDKLNHASILDACILSRAELTRYPNRDIDALETLLKKSNAKAKLVVTDGVFSMDGSIAPIDGIITLLDKYNAFLYLDDAHATGVLGENGRGTLERFNVEHPSVIQMGTLGKALGSFGAFVAGDKDLIALLVSKSRPFIFTTALPPAVCAAASVAIDVIEAEPDRRARLWENAAFFKKGLEAAGLDYLKSPTQIIPIITKDSSLTMQASKRLLENGVFTQGIRPPTVPVGASRLRVTVSSAHTKEDLTEALTKIIEVLGNGR